MKIQVDKQYMLHEGGTKFYQVLRVKVSTPELRALSPANRCVTVTHWGSQSAPPKPLRIVSCGESKIADGDSFSQKVKAKKNRGYDPRVEWGTTNVLKDAPALWTYLVQEVGAVGAKQITDLLGLGEASIPTTTDDDVTSAGEAARTASAVEVPAAAAEMDGWGEF